MGIRFLFLVLATAFIATGSEALSRRQYIDQINEQISTQNPEELNDSEILEAIDSRRNTDYVQGGNMIVTKLLPDDRQGLEHQNWVVRLSDGTEIKAVYNLDMCERVPLKVGDKVAMGGQFIAMKKSGLIHWLHHDPRSKRPDGYVYVNGKYYCL